MGLAKTVGEMDDPCPSPSSCLQSARQCLQRGNVLEIQLSEQAGKQNSTPIKCISSEQHSDEISWAFAANEVFYGCRIKGSILILVRKPEVPLIPWPCWSLSCHG